jgi:hypothetical protein
VHGGPQHSPYELAVVAHKTNDALAGAAASLGLPASVLSPRDALRTLEPGDIAPGRLDVRDELDGIERGTEELKQLAMGGAVLLNPPSALVAAHDNLLTARILRNLLTARILRQGRRAASAHLGDRRGRAVACARATCCLEAALRQLGP